MKEIWIPELISAFFLLLFLFRPLVKGLWPLDGLHWFPLLALGITLGMFPAYGFRPECIPLLVYFAVLTMLNMPALIAGAGSHHNDDFRDQKSVLILPAALLLALACAVALFFAPAEPTGPAQGLRIVNIQNERQNRSYTLHIFGPAEESAGTPQAAGQGRPLLLVIPPEAGSVRAVDALCAALGDRGFTVICYSRRGFDSLTPLTLYRMWQSFRKGTVSKKANDFGRALETGRREDLDFLLPYIKRNSADLVPGADPETMILAGCGAGGAALVYLAASPAFIAQNRQIRGIVAVESSFWSSWLPEEQTPLPVPVSATWFKKARIALQNWFAGLKPLKITGPGNIPQSGVPTLYLMSDRALDTKNRQKRYGAAFQILGESSGPAAFAALGGAGPLDYFDYPAEYPLYSALFPGLAKAPLNRGFPPEFVEKTAGIITNFAASVLRAPPAETGLLPRNGLKTQNLDEGFHIETRSWNLPDLRYILNP
ncbi:hypothetical protein AGMMS50268_17630 [Spirochaetia bacterium]|nr:hypothetical protein AGMMS50268_17630 [Spirochaetia bacterium]